MKNLNFLKLALTLAVVAQSSAVLAVEESTIAKPSALTSLKTFCTNNKKTKIAAASVAGAGLLSGIGALVYKMTRPVVIKKTGLSTLSKVGIGTGVAAIVGLAAYLIYNRALVKGCFKGDEKMNSLKDLSYRNPWKNLKIAGNAVEPVSSYIWNTPKRLIDNLAAKSAKKELELTTKKIESAAKEKTRKEGLTNANPDMKHGLI